MMGKAERGGCGGKRTIELFRTLNVIQKHGNKRPATEGHMGHAKDFGPSP